MGGSRARQQQRAAGVLIQAVHDPQAAEPRLQQAFDVRQGRVVAVGQRAQTGRLVDHQKLGIDEEYFRRDEHQDSLIPGEGL